MVLYIYNKNGRKINEIKGVKAHGFKTMFLGSGINKGITLMFRRYDESSGLTFDNCIPLKDGETFSLYNEKII